MPMPAQICQIWLPGGMISNWSAFAQIGGSVRAGPQTALITVRRQR